MSALYGRVRGSAKTEATRQGTEKSGIQTTAENWVSKVRVELEADGRCRIFIGPKNGSQAKIIFDGNADQVAREVSDAD